jgi:MerR family transcriptional regulator, redox-sensitive transcriptional activator SoxR
VPDLMIGEVARQAGVVPSTLRYYEKVGLLPSPARVSRRRQYDRRILGRIRIILLARDAGFSIRETRAFLTGWTAGKTPSMRWREMATRKAAELNELLARVAEMKSILEVSFRCECRQLEDCERLLAMRSSGGSSQTCARVVGSKKVAKRVRI